MVNPYRFGTALYQSKLNKKTTTRKANWRNNLQHVSKWKNTHIEPRGDVILYHLSTINYPIAIHRASKSMSNLPFTFLEWSHSIHSDFPICLPRTRSRVPLLQHLQYIEEFINLFTFQIYPWKWHERNFYHSIRISTNTTYIKFLKTTHNLILIHVVCNVKAGPCLVKRLNYIIN